MKKRRALVIGATGLLGYSVALKLYDEGWDVVAIGKDAIENKAVFPKKIKYYCGDFFDQSFLSDILKGIDKVFYFLSSTFPSTSIKSLENEISKTLFGLDYLLRMMLKNRVLEIVFPSSGGTIYGNVEVGGADETQKLNPSSSYAYGKKMCEEILSFYSQFGISTTVLRVGNVYGSPFERGSFQGVIDIFIQRALKNEKVEIWGNSLLNERDYIFTDDFAEGVVKIANFFGEGFTVYNLGSGKGTTLRTIIDTINKYVDVPLEVVVSDDNSTTTIKRVVLDMSSFEQKTNWHPKYDIEKGILETIKRKKALMHF